MKKLLFFLILLGPCHVCHGFSPIRYVQISTNSLTQQTGNINIQGATISTATISSGTVTNLITTTIKNNGVTTITNSSNGVAILGTNTNDNATAGNVGQSSSCSAANVSFPTSGQYGDICSITLTAGDWLLFSNMESAPNGATVTQTLSAMSTTTGNSGTGQVTGDNEGQAPGPTINNDTSIAIPGWRQSISGSTTYYLKYLASYSVATPKAWGRMTAIRIR